MNNDCDNHTVMENDCDNHIESVQHPSCVMYHNDHCDSGSNSISTIYRASSLITFSTKESSVTNVILTTKAVQSPIDEEVDKSNTWTPKLRHPSIKCYVKIQMFFF